MVTHDRCQLTQVGVQFRTPQTDLTQWLPVGPYDPLLGWYAKRLVEFGHLVMVRVYLKCFKCLLKLN